MEFPALESGSVRRRRWSMPRISALLVPLQLGLRLCVYLSLLAVSLLLTYVILETCWHAFDYLDREIFSEPWGLNQKDEENQWAYWSSYSARTLDL